MLVISMLAMWATVTANFLDEYKICAGWQGQKKCTYDADCGCPTQECVGIFEGYKTCVGCPDSIVDDETICTGLKTGCQWDSVEKKCNFKINYSGELKECVNMQSRPTCEKKEGCVWKQRKCRKFECPNVNPKKCDSIKGCSWNKVEKKCVLGDGEGVKRKNNKEAKTCRKKRKNKVACENAGCLYSRVLSKGDKPGQKPRMVQSCVPKPLGWTAAPTVSVAPSSSPTITPSMAPSMPPTTDEPTMAPTMVPTTEEPTSGPTRQPTKVPTTAEPTTADPTTAEPTTQIPTTAEPTTQMPTTAQPTSEKPAPPPPVTTEEPTAADVAVSFDEAMCKSKATEDKCEEAGCIAFFNKYNVLKCKAHVLKCGTGTKSQKACESMGDDKFYCVWDGKASREKKRCVPN